MLNIYMIWFICSGNLQEKNYYMEVKQEESYMKVERKKLLPEERTPINNKGRIQGQYYQMIQNNGLTYQANESSMENIKLATQNGLQPSPDHSQKNNDLKNQSSVNQLQNPTSQQQNKLYCLPNGEPQQNNQLIEEQQKGSTPHGEQQQSPSQVDYQQFGPQQNNGLNNNFINCAQEHYTNPEK